MKVKLNSKNKIKNEQCTQDIFLKKGTGVQHATATFQEKRVDCGEKRRTVMQIDLLQFNKGTLRETIAQRNSLEQVLTLYAPTPHNGQTHANN